MRARFARIMALLLIFAVSGCGAKNSEKVIGVWRSAERERGRYTFVEIAKDTITIGGKSGDVVLEDRDGKVSVRMAGRDDIVAVITIVDDANISLEFPGMMQQTLKLVKSSKEEQNAAENPPVENILGFWRSSEGDPAQGGVSIVEITPNSVTVDGQKRDVTITTENGVYFLASGEAKGSVTINDDTSATIVFPGALGDFIKSTPEEVAAFAEAEKAALQQYFGVWRSERFDSTINGYEVVELGDGYITRGNQKTEATLDITKLGLVVTAGGNETTITFKDSNTAVFRAGWSRTTMLRSTADEIEKLHNPKVADLMGYWILEGDAPTFKTLAIGENVLYQDGFKRPFEAVVNDEKQLHLSLPGKDGFILGRFTHAGTGRIRVKSFLGLDGDFFYRQVGKEEFDKMFEGMTDRIGVFAGYWRSAEPVSQDGAYATALIEYNAQGKKSACDRIIHFRLDEVEQRTRNPEERILEGFMGYPKGDTSKPVTFLTSPNSSIALADFNLLDANTVVIKRPNDAPLKLVRSSKEEVDRIRRR